MDRSTAAVIGLGAAGIVALKNLKAEGFDVTGYERNAYIGGLWRYSEDDQTSVLNTTVVNISKERGSFTDFPFSEDVPSYATGAQVHQYLISYAEHFNLEPHFRLNAPVQQVTFDDPQQKWIVKVRDESDKYYDKVVIAIGGMVGLPHIPTIEGLDKFEGVSIHARAFKKPQDFANKTIMVVGFGNSAADTATQLAHVASKVYLAHRHGARVIPRIVNGQPIDHTLALRLFNLQCLIIKHFPRFGERFFDKFLKGLQDKNFKLRPEWGFEPAQKVPIVSDELVQSLEKGSVESVKGVKRILGSNEVELDDGRRVEVDALIWCTGYKSDFSMIDPRFDPTAPSTTAWSSAQGSNGKSLFRLWHNVFSLDKPDSLAFLGNVHFAVGGFQIFDTASMAITQVWKGASHLPSQQQMTKDVEQHHNWLADQASRGYNFSPGNVDAGTWTGVMDDLGGTGINEYLGYGWKGWWFWLTNMKFCNLLMGGIWTPLIYRAFDGKRQKWDGAKEAIERVNEVVAASKKRQKEKAV
ncbi:dimethylaniline monooxygenase 2 [Ophiobolus disseminans]|uniref:Dimethylaniline monooxygenase 2 n=1 Tax=Ophiobolus disseminans TaxID=1469910 RepID=A0A6A6ZHY2_9PLEO|nr:dimethylaniline monooxygenase 2 [Ophiobolus disseminans]